MASSNKTSLGLTQYSLDDIPDMTDTNNDNVILTAELEKRPEADSAGKYPKAIEADTSGTADAAKNAVEGSALDARIETIEADVAQQAEKLDEFPTSGTAAMAKKLETAREIGLTGAVTGSGEFDGSGNVNIRSSGRGIRITKTTGAENAFVKLAEAKLSHAHHQAGITFLVQGSGEGNETPGINTFGILRMEIRLGNTVTSLANAFIYWEYSGTNINTSDFMLLYKPDETGYKAEFWIKNPNHAIRFTVIEETDGLNISYGIWTLSATYAAELPEGYTQVPSTYSDLKTGGISPQGDIIMGPRATPNGNSQRIAFESDDGLRRTLLYSNYQSANDNVLTIYQQSRANTSANWGNPASINTILRNVENPIAAHDAVTKLYVDTNYFKNTGGRVTGSLLIGDKNPGINSPSVSLIPGNSADDRNSIVRIYAVQSNDNLNPVIYVQSGHGYNEDNGLLPGGEDYRTRITNIANPISNTDVVPKGYADAQYLKNTGGTLAGILEIGRDRTTAHTHPIYFNVADANSSEANAYTIQMVPYGSPTHPYFWLSGTGNKYDAQRVQFRNLSDPTDVTEAATKNYVDTNCLKNTGGTLTGTVRIGPKELNKSQYLQFNYNSGQGAQTTGFQACYDPTTKKRFIALYSTGESNNANNCIKIKYVDTPDNPNEAANKAYVDAQIAALRAQLASALNLDAATLSVPNEAPTLEAPGEEEITV